jgi:hypothetical protein
VGPGSHSDRGDWFWLRSIRRKRTTPPPFHNFLSPPLYNTDGGRYVRDGGPAQLDRRLLQDLRAPPRAALALRFVVLHPIENVAGKSARVTETSGKTFDTQFPELIDTMQPMMSLRAIRHQFARSA